MTELDPGWEALTGLSLARVNDPDSWPDVVHPDDRLFLRAYARAVRSRTGAVYRVRVQTPEGFLHARIAMKPTSESGEFTGFYGFLDVSVADAPFALDRIAR